jgi:ketosteroid isomerase-like protein
MRTKTAQSVLLAYFVVAFFITFLNASEGHAAVSNKEQVTMEEMAKRLDDMQNKLTVLEDIEAIKKLQVEYVNLLQRGKYDTIGDYFSEDALLEAVAPKVKGRREIIKYFQETQIKIHKGMEGDILTSPSITVDGNTAKGTWNIFFFYYHPKTYQTLWFTHMWYDMDFIKENRKWKISRLGTIHNIEPPGGHPSDEMILNFLDNAQKTMQEMPKQ